MKKITRNDNEECILVFNVPFMYSDTSTPELQIKRNTEDTWVVKTTTVYGTDCCGYIVKLTLDTSDMLSGSFFIKAVVDNLYTAIEEYVLVDDTEDIVSNYEGVKIIE